MVVRGKNKLKNSIMNVLASNRGHVLSVEEVKASLFIEKSEISDFEKALKELEKEGKIRKYIRLP